MATHTCRFRDPSLLCSGWWSLTTVKYTAATWARTEQGWGWAKAAWPWVPLVGCRSGRDRGFGATGRGRLTYEDIA
jgi:hypothetical protein